MIANIKFVIVSILPQQVINWIKLWYYPWLLKTGRFSPEPEMEGIKDIIDLGDRVVDLGANFGAYTNFLSKCVGDEGEVYSFEPIATTYRYLKRGVQYSGLKNVTCYNLAASDQEASFIMTVPRSNSKRLNFFRASISTNTSTDNLNKDDFLINAVRIDSILKYSHERIAFIKCDVEGHELAALTGAEGILKRHHPTIFVEISGDPDAPNTDAGLLFSMLSNFGYEAFWHDGLQFHRRKSGDRKINYFFLTKDQVDKLALA